MRDSNRFVVAQAALAGLALLLLLGVAAEAIQSPLGGSALNTDRPDVADVVTPTAGNAAQDGKTIDLSAFTANDSKNETFTGILVGKGSDMVLREDSGKTYRLDGLRTEDKWNNAKAFEGRPVKITGKLEVSAGLIHVTDLEGQSV